MTAWIRRRLTGLRWRRTGTAVMVGGVMAAGLVAVATPAHAATGNMTFPGEFGKVFEGELKTSTGQSVQNMCNCTGNVTAHWTGGGADHQDVRYISNETSFGHYNTTVVRYRSGVGTATWKADRKAYCQGIASGFGDSDCVEYDMPAGKRMVARDGTYMGHAEWQAVKEGMTLSKVHSVCACTGAWNGNQGSHNGNTYKQQWFKSLVGTAFVWFRFGSDGAWHVGWGKDWCPGWTESVPHAGCDHVSFG